jgi:hypothetical protein
VTPVLVVLFPVVLGALQAGVERSKRRRNAGLSVGGPLAELERQVREASMQVGAELAPSSAFAPVFKGWNVWTVVQVRDLPFSVAMIGVSRDRQLRVWVEDAVRLGAPGAVVADPVDLKGGQVEILPAVPAGLKVAKSKESVPGDAMVVESQEQPPELRVVRFFNRGEESRVVWPHDDSYLLDQVLEPDPKNDATKGPGPGTITTGVVKPIGEGATELLKYAAVAVGLVLVVLLGMRVAAARGAA